MSHTNGYPDSYYAATLGNVAKRPALLRDMTVDTCVIGAGLAGLTSALELLRAGKSVALLEAKRIGWGASGRNGGFVSAGFAGSAAEMLVRLGPKDAREAYQLSADAVQFVHRQITDLNMSGVLHGRGAIQVYRKKNARTVLDHCKTARENFGRDLTYYDTNETRKLMKTTRYHHALYDPDGFNIHPLKYCHGLAREIGRLGGVIFEDCKAETLTRSKPGWRVSTKAATITAQHIVLCTSAYDFKLAPQVSRAMQPVATYVITTQPMTELLDQVIATPASIADTRRAGDYYRRLPDGRLLWGGRITTRQSVPPRLADLMRRDMLSVYPLLGAAKTSHAWAGLMGYALHSMPLIGQIEDGLWMATAFGGQGLNTTAMAGCLIAAGISGTDDRYKLFSPYKRSWTGGLIGRAGVQMKYWAMQMQDQLDEAM
jgi:glycine/D-amino acid oxidase-like deaminating enzyme